MKIFSPSLKRQLKDCILSIFWPKKDIYRFFKDCSIPKQTLSKVEDWVKKEYSRAEMIDVIFDTLGEQSDNGTFHFNIMLDTLADWEHFDEYWFKTQEKLDLRDAKAKIAKLKSSKTKSVDKAKRRARAQKEKTLAREEHYKSLDEMRTGFQEISMGSGSPQQRGYAFEKFLAKMMRFYSISVTNAFKIKGTQIDGAIKFEGEHYNIEAKWHDHFLSDEPLMAFCHKQEINMHGRGIFISVNGYTNDCLSMLERSSIKNTFLMDGEDITLILNEMVSLKDALDAKIKAAQTKGLFYVNPITGNNKII